MKRVLACLMFAMYLLTARSFAAAAPPFDIGAQLDAVGGGELTEAVPEETKRLLSEAGVDELSVEELLQLSPKEFFAAVWRMVLREAGKPVRTLGVILGVAVLSALLRSLAAPTSESSLSEVFSVVAVLSILAAAVTPILDCVVDTSAAIESASAFMLTFIPVFSAALLAAGQAVTGAAYNLFLFSACQVASQVVAGTLLPLLGIYLAVCTLGVLSPELRIESAARSVRAVVSWGLGLTVTAFVGLFSVQTMVSGSADGVTARTAKFLIGSFVPVVGGALSETVSAARGCLRLIKTSVGAYGILAAAFVVLPVLLRAVCWYFVAGAAAVAGDLLGVNAVASLMRSCSGALGILIAVIVCFALLIIVSTTVVMVVGMGG